MNRERWRKERKKREREEEGGRETVEGGEGKRADNDPAGAATGNHPLVENVSDERQKERRGEDRGEGGSYRVHVGGCSVVRRKGERAVYRMHIEASFHGHRRLVLLPGLDTHAVNGGKVVRLNVAKEWNRLMDIHASYSADETRRIRFEEGSTTSRKKKEEEEEDVDRCVDEIGGGDRNKLSI